MHAQGTPDTIDLGSGAHLERSRDDHLDAVFAAIDRSRDNLRRWMPWVDQAKRPADITPHWTECQERCQRGELVDYVVVLNGTICGRVDIHDISIWSETGSFGYWLAADAQGLGLMTRAVTALTTLAYLDLELNRLQISMATGNERSRRVAERVGYRREAVL